MPSALTTIARAASAMDASLMITALEGAGFDVFAPGYHTLSNLPHLGVALGGAGIMVPVDQAGDALTFLAALPGPEDADAPPPMSSWQFLRRVAVGALYLSVGAAPSLRGVFRRNP
jgi:hypothetical protein